MSDKFLGLFLLVLEEHSLEFILNSVEVDRMEDLFNFLYHSCLSGQSGLEDPIQYIFDCVHLAELIINRLAEFVCYIVVFVLAWLKLSDPVRLISANYFLSFVQTECLNEIPNSFSVFCFYVHRISYVYEIDRHWHLIFLTNNNKLVAF